MAFHDGDNDLSPEEVRALEMIARTRVCASYWDDPTVARYRSLGLVRLEDRWIRLTDAGIQAVGSSAGYLLAPAALESAEKPIFR